MTPTAAPHLASAAPAAAPDAAGASRNLLISIEADYTLGVYGRPRTLDVLADLSPLPRAHIATVERAVLQTAPALTDDLVADICNQLRIAPGRWRSRRKTGGFTAFTAAASALTELNTLAQVVALSDLSIIAGPRALSEIEQHLGGYLSGIYGSFELGARKPDPLCWQRVAARHGRTVDQLVHIGPDAERDVRGALAAGCAGAILLHPRDVPVAPDLAVHPRVAVVENLSEACGVLRAWVRPAGSDSAPPRRSRATARSAVAALRVALEPRENGQ